MLVVLVPGREFVRHGVDAAQLSAARRADERRLKRADADVFEPCQCAAGLEQQFKMFEESAHFLRAETIEGQPGNDRVPAMLILQIADVALVDRDAVLHFFKRRLALAQGVEEFAELRADFPQRQMPAAVHALDDLARDRPGAGPDFKHAEIVGQRMRQAEGHFLTEKARARSDRAGAAKIAESLFDESQRAERHRILFCMSKEWLQGKTNYRDGGGYAKKFRNACCRGCN